MRKRKRKKKTQKITEPQSAARWDRISGKSSFPAEVTLQTTVASCSGWYSQGLRTGAARALVTLKGKVF